MKNFLTYFIKFSKVLLVILVPTISLAQPQLFISEKKINNQELETFRITKSVDKVNMSPYLIAMSNANFDTYRLTDSRRTITFDSGVLIELLSANELSNNFPERMKKIILTKKDIENQPQPVFKLNGDGTIIAIHPMIIKQSEEIKMKSR